jgi:succinate dehydrogenase / fumarate reductase flavoprotein subunit
VRELRDRLLLARVVVRGALARDESRGAHFKPDFPQRDDPNWLKTTIAEFDGARSPKFSYESVDVSLIKPRLRSYVKASHGGKEAKS